MSDPKDFASLGPRPGDVSLRDAMIAEGMEVPPTPRQVEAAAKAQLRAERERSEVERIRGLTLPRLVLELADRLQKECEASDWGYCADPEIDALLDVSRAAALAMTEVPLSPESRRSLDAGLADARAGRILPLELADHEAILLKYISLIRAHEGTDYLAAIAQTRERPEDERMAPGESKETDAEMAFTDAELAELRRLAGEGSR